MALCLGVVLGFGVGIWIYEGFGCKLRLGSVELLGLGLGAGCWGGGRGEAPLTELCKVHVLTESRQREQTATWTADVCRAGRPRLQPLQPLQGLF